VLLPDIISSSGLNITGPSSAPLTADLFLDGKWQEPVVPSLERIRLADDVNHHLYIVEIDQIQHNT
jgi:hypothetical protein